jgi:hypothetical protein
MSTPSNALYRVHYTWERGATSSGEVKYFESRVRLEVFLLEAHLDMRYEEMGRSRNTWSHMMLARLWRKYLARIKGEDPDDLRRVKQIISVHGLVEGQWVEMATRFTDPKVDLIPLEEKESRT